MVCISTFANLVFASICQGAAIFLFFWGEENPKNMAIRIKS